MGVAGVFYIASTIKLLKMVIRRLMDKTLTPLSHRIFVGKNEQSYAR